MKIVGKNGTSEVVFAADLGGTHLRGALIDGCGHILTQVKNETPKDESPSVIVNALASALSECREKVDHLSADAASIVVPGTVDRSNSFIVGAPNLPSLNNYNLKSALEQRLSLPIVLENDANAAAVGEMWLGAARGARNVICLTLGTGVGGGIILDGKLWRGTEGSAGEIGHTTVDPFGGPKCKCGNNGCLEMYASATAIVRMTKERLAEFPGSSLEGKEITALHVYQAGVNGDPLSIAIFRTVGDYLGAGLANLINILGPEIIVIGGGVANAWDLFAPSLFEQVKLRAFPSLSRNIKITPALLGDNAGLLGAAYLAK